MQRHRRGGFEQFAVDGGEDAHVVVAASGAADDRRVLVDRLQKLANDERDGLDPFHLLLRMQILLKITI